MHPKNLKIFLVTKNGPGYNKNNKKFESAMFDIHDGMHSTSLLSLLFDLLKTGQIIWPVRKLADQKKKI